MIPKYFSAFKSQVRKRKKLVIIALIIAALAGLYFYRKAQANKPVYTTATVEKGSLTKTLTLSGSIKAQEDVTLNFQSGGKLARLAVKEGDVVKKGQLIASLDQRSVRKNLDKTLNNFVKTRYDLDQERDDVNDTITNDTVKRVLEKAQYDVNNSIIDVELQSLTIEFSNLYSPVAGLVTSTHGLQYGMNVSAATDIVNIVGPDVLYVELTADQTEVTELKDGMKGELLLDAYSDEKLPGNIDLISFTPKAGESNTVYVVRFQFLNSSNATQKYRVGMTGDVEFITDEKQNVLYVPFAFVQEEGDKKYVQVMKNGKLEKRYVKTGLETDDDVEIISGLSEGDIVYD